MTNETLLPCPFECDGTANYSEDGDTMGYKCPKCEGVFMPCMKPLRAQQKAPEQDVHPVAWRVCNINNTKFFTDKSDAEDWQNLFEYTGITPLYERPATPPSEVVSINKVTKEIREICEEYDRQIEENGYVDTPGGIEHKGDAFKLIKRWNAALQHHKPGSA